MPYSYAHSYGKVKNVFILIMVMNEDDYHRGFVVIPITTAFLLR